MTQPIERPAHVPRQCTWELGDGAGEGDLGTAECLEVVPQLATLGTTRLILTVGEPSVGPDWSEIARTATALGLTVELVTDGPDDTSELALAAVEAGLSSVGVRFDGLGSAHDLVRGAGSFERSGEAVRALDAHGLDVDMLLTVHPSTLADLEPLFSLARVVGARQLRCGVGPDPTTSHGCAAPTIQPRSLLELLPILGRLSGLPGPAVRIEDSVGFFGPHERALRGRRGTVDYFAGCFAGLHSVGITRRGEIKGCLALRPAAEDVEDPFVEGSLREASFADIWLDPEAFAYNRAPQPLTGHCRACTYSGVCGGGARCVAQALTGGFGDNPMCYHQVAIERARESWPPAVRLGA